MSQKQFIPAGDNLQQSDQAITHFVDMSKEQLHDRWNSTTGQNILRQWKKSNYSRDELDKLVGRYYGNTDLRGIDLSERDLIKIDLNHIDFYSANLKKADLSQSNLQGCWLSEANIMGTKFDWSKMDDVIIDNTQFNHATSFYGIDLYKINFTLATLLKDLAEDQQRIATLEYTRPKTALFLKWSCDYGRSFGLFFFWTFSIITFYTLLYLIPMLSIKGIDGFIDSLYFSVITFTTLGYGDILPGSNLGKLVVISEVFIGFVMLGLLVGIISRKVIGR
jgi:hypothetical protein